METPTQLDGLEIAIKITLVLLILSLIVEKITSFIKLYYPSLFTKSFTEEEEKLREKKIQRNSIIIGILVALGSNADFFNMMGGIDLVYWDKVEIKEIPKAILGCFISGLFLSQGSKFFHDLLDTLLYAKRMRKGLYEEQDLINSQIQNENNLNADQLLAYAIQPEDRDDDAEVSL